ncbi:tetratricopeptide repeat protein [Schlesneria sp.]|uniref:tetratricopeptide repeat protein n=1 Tax=Schlesneria sp. TaxID=2762018 RepID=UPI002F03CCE5
MTQKKPASQRKKPSATTATPDSPVRKRVGIGLIVIALLAAGFFLTPVLIVARARTLLARREPQPALAWLDRARWFGTYHGEIEFLRARAYRRLGDLDRFRTSMQAALEQGYPARLLEREQVLMLAQVGRLREVEAKLPDILVNANEDSGEVCEAYVGGLLLNFQQERALAVIDSWSKDYPHDPQPELIRAQVLQNAGRFKEADAAYLQAMKRAPHSSEIKMRRALALLADRKIEPARALLQTLLTDTQYHDRASLQIAHCERILGNHAQSQAALDQITDPGKLPDEDLKLEQGLLALDQGNFQIAVECLEQVKKLQPRSLEVGHALARALRGAGRIDEATSEAHRVVESEAQLSRVDKLQVEVAGNPANLELRLDIGKTLLKYGDPKRGVSWLQSVLNLDPGNRDANLALGDYYQSLDPPSAENEKLANIYLERARQPSKSPTDSPVDQSENEKLLSR